MLTVQKEASLWRLMMSSALVMLPVLTHGTVSAFLTIALPKLQKPNPTGMVIDLYQVSWLGETARSAYILQSSHSQPFQSVSTSPAGYWGSSCQPGYQRSSAGREV